METMITGESYISKENKSGRKKLQIVVYQSIEHLASVHQIIFAGEVIELKEKKYF